MTSTRAPEGKPPLRGTLRLDEPMARHVSWRAGGSAERYYEPADLEDLAAFLRTLEAEEALLWLGLGSNLLVRDGGFRGTVIATATGLGGLHLEDARAVHAQAGVPCAHVARAAARAGGTGTEFLAGIPGTLGGALAMNAGAFGGETWDRVIEVQTLDRAGVARRRPAADYRVGYRQVVGPGEEWFAGAVLRLEPDPTGAGERRIRALLAERQHSQPMGRSSCGSVFRNPPGDHAGRLIEAAGLKGLREGGCHVSTKHANFIINDRGASAGEIETLIERVRGRVLEVHGVELVCEVSIVGIAP